MSVLARAAYDPLQTLDVIEAAEYCKCSTDTIYRHAKHLGKKVGKKYVFLVRDLANWISGESKWQESESISEKTKPVKKLARTSTVSRSEVMDEYSALLKPKTSRRPTA